MSPVAVTLLAFDDEATSKLLERALNAKRIRTVSVHSASLLQRQVLASAPALVIMQVRFGGEDAFKLAESLLADLPTLPIIIYAPEKNAEILTKALRLGIADILTPPLSTEDIYRSVEQTLNRAQRIGDWLRKEIRRSTTSLRQHSEALETLLELGRDITRNLELDRVLASIVAAAVNLLKAEEGSLLLADEASGELYVRASKNFDQNLVETLRLPVHDSLAGQVIKSGKPLVINSENAQKIKTSYLVHSLVYVPLRQKNKVIGVLSVDNRAVRREFDDSAVTLLSILADYAVIAMENARLYTNAQQERNKLETIFRNIRNGVVILDKENRIVLINPAARQAFHIPESADLQGLPITEVVPNADLKALLERTNADTLTYHEINTSDGEIYSAQCTPIPGLGTALTIHDITYLKDLDRLKTDFIHTVSHDLRSPLTAVLGYAELLERVGTLTPQQTEFVRRIQASVQNITELVNDLLDLGRIESGFDTRKEPVNMVGILKYVLDTLQMQIQQKKQDLQLHIQDNIPTVRGNPIRLRQMMDNLIGNAVKYTPEGGQIQVRLFTTEDQLIFEVSDNGPGIPIEDQPHIFEKFYRSNNTQEPGSGLGLAIVKSIVEAHNGRIWVNSVPNQGATFTVVLPLDRK